MNILIIVAHPDQQSFNHAIALTCIERLAHNGHKAKFHDLYLEDFQPVLRKDEIPKDAKIDDFDLTSCHINDLKVCDGIIIIHPNWWGQPPAILKGWIDRVIRPGIAYEFKDGDKGEGIPIGLLKAKIGLIFNTSNTSEGRENRVFKDPLETIWKNCIFGLCGIRKFDRRMFSIVITSDFKQREKWLSEVTEMIDKNFPKIKKK
jgi:NAD(P)H dehydrogenase (quinone)